MTFEALKTEINRLPLHPLADTNIGSVEQRGTCLEAEVDSDELQDLRNKLEDAETERDALLEDAGENKDTISELRRDLANARRLIEELKAKSK